MLREDVENSMVVEENWRSRERDREREQAYEDYLAEEADRRWKEEREEEFT